MRALLILFVISLAAICTSSGVFARSACYSTAEAEAEQGIRIHSELMVIGLNCQHMMKTSNNKNLYAQYREFTKDHESLFAGYEERLMAYYKRTGIKNPERRLDTVRTAFANKISYDAARMRPDMFCYRYAPRISKIENMDRASVKKWAGTFFPSHPVSQPLCK